MVNDCAIFVDTNIYLHYELFVEIPWNELARAKNAVLLVPPTVLREIDKHKYDPRLKRVRERAALVAQRFGQLSKSDDAVRPGVRIQFIASEPKDFDSLSLDRTSEDDRLIASILEYTSQQPGTFTFLVTDDVLMTIKAQNAQIPLLEIPDTYRLPVQPNEEQAKIQQLQRQLNELQSLTPKLVLRFDNGSQTCRVQRPPVPPAERSWQDVERIKETYPHLWQAPLELGLVNAFSQLSFNRLSEHEIEEYNRKLDHFYLRSEEYLEGCYKIDDLKSRSLTLNVEVANTGKLPAEDIRALIKVLPPLDLCGSDRFSYPKKPTPPRKPQPGERVNISDLVVRPYPSPFNAADLSRAMERQRVRWLGLSQENDFKVATFEVQKLNHPYSEKCPHPIIVVFDNRDAMNSFTIEFEISAANVPEKQTGQLHVIVTDTDT